MSAPKAPNGPIAVSAPPSGQQSSGVRLMISPEPDAPERARVIGSLSSDSVHVLVEAVDGGVNVLDLSQVDQIDHHAVRELARLWERCTLLSLPRWLELWLARVRRNGGG
jgi:hypothetical protein